MAKMHALLCLALCFLTAPTSTEAAAPRFVRISGQSFVLASGEPIVLSGANVVVKGGYTQPTQPGQSACHDPVLCRTSVHAISIG